MRSGIGACAAALAVTVVFALAPAAAQAAKGGEQGTRAETYGPQSQDFFTVYPGGPAAVLLLHENGHVSTSMRGTAELLQKAGYTALAMEWRKVPEPPGGEIWGPLTEQIEEAVRYTDAHASALGIDPKRLAMVGGSGGANLSLLTALDVDAVAPGTIKAVASLSGDVDPQAELERTLASEAQGESPNEKVIRKFARTYGCKGGLQECPMEYMQQWSPFQKATEMSGGATPPMMLAASVEENSHRVASWEDQLTMAAALEAKGVPAVIERPTNGHGFAYMGAIHKQVLAFLSEHDG
jgi:acetyl esterase/lipase